MFSRKVCSFPWYVVLYRTVWCFDMQWHAVTSKLSRAGTYCVVLWHAVSCCDAVSCCEMLCRAVTCCNVLWRTVWCCDMPCYAVTWCDVLWHYVTCCVLLWRDLTFCTVLACCVVLYRAALCRDVFFVIWNDVPCCAVTWCAVPCCVVMFFKWYSFLKRQHCCPLMELLIVSGQRSCLSLAIRIRINQNWCVWARQDI